MNISREMMNEMNTVYAGLDEKRSEITCALTHQMFKLRSGWLTREGTEVYRMSIERPPLSPPGIVFPIVWTILFALMGIGAARIYSSPASGERTRSLRLFFAQLFFNFFWSIIFFNFQAFGFAFLWIVALWVLILMMILSFRKIDPISAWLQVPYLLWVTFAAYLNFGVWLLNR